MLYYKGFEFPTPQTHSHSHSYSHIEFKFKRCCCLCVTALTLASLRSSLLLKFRCVAGVVVVVGSGCRDADVLHFTYSTSTAVCRSHV